MKLSGDEQLELWTRARQGDIQARDRLVLSTMGFVHQVALRYARGCPTVDVDDLRNEGILGAMRAIEKFEPQVGVKFFTYAGSWIRAYISRSASWDKARFGGSGAARAIGSGGRFRRDREELLAEGRTEEEIAKELSGRYRVSESVVVRMRVFLFKTKSLDAPVLGMEDATLHDVLKGPGASPDEQIADRQIRDIVSGTLRGMKLSEREKAIVEEKLLSESPLSLADLGKRFGLSRERLRQLEERLLRRMEKQLAARGFDSRPENWLTMAEARP